MLPVAPLPWLIGPLAALSVRCLTPKVSMAHHHPVASPPILWGIETVVRERLGNATSVIKCRPREVVFEYPFSPADTVSYYLQYYGPTLRAYANCSPEKQVLLRCDLERLWSDHNQATDGTTHEISEYLEVVATRA